MNTTTDCPQLLDLAAAHLAAAAHHTEANARGDLTSPWHSLAGPIRLIAGGVSPVCDNDPVTPRPFGSIGDTPSAARVPLHAAMEAMGQADRPQRSVTTATPPSHEYVTAARGLHVALTETTHDRPHACDINEIIKNLDLGQALADLRYAASDVADLVRDVEHLPDQLARSGLLFAPAAKLTPSVERLHERAAGRCVSVLPDELPELASTARSATRRSETAARMLDRTLSQAFPLAIAETGARRTLCAPEL